MVSDRKTGTLNRRKFLAGVGAGALAAPMVVRAGRAFGAVEPITIFTWETYHEDPWIAEWSAKSGVAVNVVRTGSVDEMYAQTRSGAVQADVLYFDSGSIKRYKEAELIAPIDVAKIPNAKNITAGLKYEERNAVDGAIYGLPYNWGTQPLMFEEGKVSATDSWEIGRASCRERV